MGRQFGTDCGFFVRVNLLKSMDFESAFDIAISQAWYHLDCNGGYLDSETFVKLVVEYYQAETYGMQFPPDEPDNPEDVIRNRAMEVWADDISYRQPTEQSLRLEAPVADLENWSLDSWVDISETPD